MSSAVKACFSSCLSNTQSFLFKPDNHLAKFVRSSEGRDKTLKLADPILDTIGEIAKAAGASQTTLEGIGKVRSLAKVGRDAHAFLNIFNGVIPGIFYHSKNCGRMVQGLVTGNDVRFKRENKNPAKNKHTDVVVGRKEIGLVLGANFGKGVASASYAFGFGVCRPIDNINKYVRDKEGKPLVHMSESALKLGHAFSTVMMINHVGGLIGGGCEIAYQYVAFDRAVVNGYKLEKAYKRYKEKIVEETIGIIEKFLDLLMDITHLLGKAVPAWFRLPVTLSIGILSIYKEWRKTA